MRTKEENIYHCRAIWQAKKQAKFDRIRDNAEYVATLTPLQRLARLDERLGSGVGARKERARLWRMVA